MKRRAYQALLWGVALAATVACGACAQKPASGKAEKRLLGRWVRPDGGYVLEIRGAAARGMLDATYFNPDPIHVAKAEAAREQGALKIHVELRDVNYPGSTYDLVYDPVDDSLKGTYFQAVARETYPICFVRQKP